MLFINGEDGGTEIERRVLAFCLAHAHKLAGQNLDRLYVLEQMTHGSNAYHSCGQQKKFFNSRPEGFEVLKSALEALRPDVIDTRSARCVLWRRQHERQRGDGAGIRELKRLATECDCAVLIVHHTRKGGTTATPRRSVGPHPSST